MLPLVLAIPLLPGLVSEQVTSAKEHIEYLRWVDLLLKLALPEPT